MKLFEVLALLHAFNFINLHTLIVSETRCRGGWFQAKTPRTSLSCGIAMTHPCMHRHQKLQEFITILSNYALSISSPHCTILPFSWWFFEWVYSKSFINNLFWCDHKVYFFHHNLVDWNLKDIKVLHTW